MTDHPLSFYVTGGTLPPDAPSYVEREADHTLLDGLRRGELCHVLTSRQMGKSSLMIRAASRLRAEGVRVAVLDLTALGQNLSPEQWYRGLLTLLGEQLGAEEALDRFWERHPHLGPMHRFMAALKRVAASGGPDERLILFLDEIDAVRNLPFPTDEFFAAIRECYNGRALGQPGCRVTFCLIGAAAAADLVKDPRVTPFNVGRRIELLDFTPDEAAPLALGLAWPGAKSAPAEAVRTAGPVQRRLLRRVLHWTGGHPYLTQTLCKAVAGAAGRKLSQELVRSAPERIVDQQVHELFLSRQARRTEENLLFVQDEVLRGSEDRAEVLEQYARVLAGWRVADEETSSAVSALRLAGIVRSARGRLRPRNRIYARVFNRSWAREHLPAAESRRQRAAFLLSLIHI